MNNELAKYIDHTQLKPDTTKDSIEKLVAEAKEYEFASVCVNPSWVPFCYEKLKDTNVKVCTVIGFPLGATSTQSKVFETEQAIKDGATEVDMVINIGLLKSGEDDPVKQDIAAVVKAAENKALTKVIIETSLLTEDEKIRACKLAKEAGADFVKTSTGFSTGGATVEDIKLMRKTVGSDLGVKASGGVRDLETTKAMIDAGATRIGASAGVDIIHGGSGTSDY
ncbi:deoxyribose-phosphate aldolase [Virgibacillus halodenitrificans]|uniref:Deoxyribose-phosphate aldolase n=1 Tax=Virgibacillus halodenitrificans TaxID=1482 RepID=A0AAC9J401_VIRHA|nr:deoxyribose-phosphate aldolase [Virgibacillus halodenitrificans]APC50223.1 deoxyribose-phosphate aldolase [Virgibacillus halodenitrificans]MCJ0930820.1 deoxyribose-phosphate aldolase [Virgibacillus halodenitrificans]MEC2160051.1 deoxyribose-phosphate aldolase [Virgibacillus halodenitrificans]WHX28174.1 deoxyribose-phosphate aldolase [Virgibacillus halodenitrificans]